MPDYPKYVVGAIWRSPLLSKTGSDLRGEWRVAGLLGQPQGYTQISHASILLVVRAVGLSKRILRLSIVRLLLSFLDGGILDSPDSLLWRPVEASVELIIVRPGWSSGGAGVIIGAVIGLAAVTDCCGGGAVVGPGAVFGPDWGGGAPPFCLIGIDPPARVCCNVALA